MKILYFFLLVPLSIAVWQDRSVHTLTDNLGDRHGGNYTFLARVINRTDNNGIGGTAVLENSRSKEVMSVTLGSTKVQGDIGNATIGVRGNQVSLVGWSPIRNQGDQLGTVTDKRGAFAKINDRWYRIESIEAFNIGTGIIGRVAYGNDTILRIDPN